MIKKSTIAVLLFSLLTPGLVSALKKSSFKFDKTKLQMAAGGTAELKVNVFVPQGQHIYVKYVSALSFNILTSFKVQEDSGFGLLAEAPAGEQKDNDMILKGKGTSVAAGQYKLTLFETLGRKPSNRTYRVKVQVETQACDSRSNVCFRPRKFTQALRVKVAEEKLVVNFRSTSNVKWVTSYDQAYSRASEKNQNVFVVITAPTWCGYCIQMERNVFPRKNVENILNDKFVSLRLTDKNPERRKFKFRGYPTLIVTDSSKKELTRSIRRSADGLVASLTPYAKSSGNTSSNDDLQVPVIKDDANTSDEVFNYSLSIKGLFKNIGNKKWVSLANGARENFKEIKRDSRYIILKHESRKEYIALPIEKDQAYTFVNGKWKPYFTIRR